jgi:hypothetical protein
LFLGVALSVAAVSAANAQGLGGTVTQEQPAAALIMPFDVTDGHASFQLVSRIGGEDVAVIATHWSFWSDSCDHLADVFICLTPRDTVVVDPTALQGQIQVGQDNVPTGPKINLHAVGDIGSKGFITVTAFEADPSGTTCQPADETAIYDVPSLIGSWVIANTSTSAAYGNNAIGIIDGVTLPDAATFFITGPVAGGLFLQTFNPLDLHDSAIFLIGVASPNGNGVFADVEIGPIPGALSNGSFVCCNAQYYNNVEAFISLPDICFDCMGHFKIADNDSLADVPLSPIIPLSIPADTSGIVRITNCKVGSEGLDTVIGDSALPSFVFAFHGMAVGPFGTSAIGRYTAE